MLKKAIIEVAENGYRLTIIPSVIEAEKQYVYENLTDVLNVIIEEDKKGNQI